MDPTTTTTTLLGATDPAMQELDLNVWSLIQQGALSTYPLLFCWSSSWRSRSNGRGRCAASSRRRAASSA
jgi:hypothetical protein